MKMLADFWTFVIERESIRRRRRDGLPRERWTSDWVLQSYSFTNVKRDYDRTTTLLRQEFYDVYVVGTELYPQIRPAALLNAAIFRFFGTIEFARAIGWTWEWTAARREEIRQIAESRALYGETLFTGAYIVPAAGRSEPKYEIVLEAIDSIVPSVASVLGHESWETMCDDLCHCYCVGQFMAKEILLDYFLATSERPIDWQTWTPVGPGARRGAAWVRDGYLVDKLNEAAALEICREIYATAGAVWPFEDMPLDLTDVQFQLCEFDKYCRAKIEKRRPKRLFRPTIDDVTEARK